MEKYIIQILENNNRVIVPDFGAFIVKQRKPLTIVFNEFLQYNDGMLVDTVSKSEDLDREKAKEKIDDFVKSIVTKLDKGENYPLEKLGVLIKNTSGKVSLEGEDFKTTAKPKPAAKDVKKEPVKETKEQEDKAKAEQEKKTQEDKAKAEQEKKAQGSKAKTEQEKKTQDDKAKAEQEKKAQEEMAKTEQEKRIQEEKEQLEKEKKAKERLIAGQAERNTVSQASKAPVYQSTASHTEYHKKKSNKRKIVLWVIVILLINGILITGYFVYEKDLPDFFRKSDTNDLLIEEPVVEEDNYVIESYDDVSETPEVEEVTPEEEIVPEAKPQKTSVLQGTKYYIVAGAFSNEQNADNLVIDLNQKGYNAEKFGKIGNLHAVSYNVFNNKPDADRLLKKIQAETDPQAWIKKVN